MYRKFLKYLVLNKLIKIHYINIMNFNNTYSGYKSITYRINFATDFYAKTTTSKENLNDCKEARAVINQIKNKLTKKP